MASAPESEAEEETKDVYLQLDESSNGDAEVNIAIIGQSGSGRSSFVRNILG
jgi:ABC-type phosphate/phosphonate transport system ATPase subunit